MFWITNGFFTIDIMAFGKYVIIDFFSSFVTAINEAFDKKNLE